MKNIIIADNQDITRAGMAYVLSKRDNISCQVARDKSELILLFKRLSRSGCDIRLYLV